MNVYIASIHTIDLRGTLVSLITLYQDITFTETKKRVEQDKILVTKKPSYTPNFKTGTSVFKERPLPFWKRLFLFWKRPRQLIILVDASPTALNLELKDGQKPAYNLNFGTVKETMAFIDKAQRKSRADQKPISNNQFLILALMLGAVLMFQFMLMRGMTF